MTAHHRHASLLVGDEDVTVFGVVTELGGRAEVEVYRAVCDDHGIQVGLSSDDVRRAEAALRAAHDFASAKEHRDETDGGQ